VATRGGDIVTAGGAGSGHADRLRPFTTTAQVPAVGRFDPRPGDAPWSVRRVRRPAPLALRVAVWLTGILLLVGLAGLGIHRLRPSALRALEVRPSPSSSAAAEATTTPPAGTAHPRQTGPTVPVSQTATSATGATMEVETSQYTVKVSAQAPCWVEATAPGAPAPLYDGLLTTGDEKAFSALDGQLELLLGASRVTVEVALAGSTTPAWTFVPTTAPFDLQFTSAPA